MNDEILGQPLFLLVISALIVSAILVKALSHRLARIPPVVGYIALGALLRALEDRFDFLPSAGAWTLDFLAQVGVAALLFRVGLRSDLGSLVSELPRAVRVWVSDVCVAAGVGLAAALLLGFAWIPALFVAVSLSATSVGVSIAVWEDARKTRSRLGALLLDIAELDDLSAVLLLLVLLGMTPHLRGSGVTGNVLISAAESIGLLLVKLAAFAIACWLFARHLEQPFTRWVTRAERPPDRVLTIVGAGFAVAGIAGVAGFSSAVGALFAGLMFSRDPVAVRDEASFEAIYAFFTPLFFIDVGFALDLAVIGSSFALGAAIFVAAALGKLVGAGGPVAALLGLRAGALVGLSMVPRAEIALLVARTGNQLGQWAVPDALYGGIVFASALASIASPLVLQRLLSRWEDLPGLEVGRSRPPPVGAENRE